MKIRHQTLLNNLITGILPLLLVSGILLILQHREENTQLRRSMESYVDTFKIALEADLEKYRNYTYFISHQNFRITEQNGRTQFRLSDESMFGTRYKIRMYEIFLGSTNYYRDIYNWRDVMYAASPGAVEYLWDHLQKPQFTRRHTTSLPDLVSNVLVMRNCSIIYDHIRELKRGFAEIVTPLDYDYFSEFAFQEFDLVYFIQTPGGFVFSNPELNRVEVSRILEEVVLADSGELPKVQLDDGKTYYYFRSPLMQVAPLDLRSKALHREWAYIGILYDVSLRNKQFLQFQGLSRVAILFSVLLLSLISLWFSNRLTRPLSRLESDIARFDREMTPIEAPAQVRDEISSIQNSFAAMSRHILENTQTIQAERNKLQIQQELMDTELELARNIQMNLIPKTSPVEYIRFFYRPMEKLGGDFFQVYDLDLDRICVFISDVSGHGVPAALVTTMLNSFIIQNLDLADRPADFLFELNEFLIQQSTQNFVTALFGVYDPGRRTFHFSLAGHNLPYIIKGSQVFCPWVSNRGLPLGILSNHDLRYMEKPYMDASLQLAAGDHLLFTTDGVEETVNEEQHRAHPESALPDFSESRLVEVIHEHVHKKRKDLIRSLLRGLEAYRGRESFDDDVCIIDLEVR